MNKIKIGEIYSETLSFQKLSVQFNFKDTNTPEMAFF